VYGAKNGRGLGGGRLLAVGMTLQGPQQAVREGSLGTLRRWAPHWRQTRGAEAFPGSPWSRPSCGNRKKKGTLPARRCVPELGRALAILQMKLGMRRMDREEHGRTTKSPEARYSRSRTSRHPAVWKASAAAARASRGSRWRRIMAGERSHCRRLPKENARRPTRYVLPSWKNEGHRSTDIYCAANAGNAGSAVGRTTRTWALDARLVTGQSRGWEVLTSHHSRLRRRRSSSQMHMASGEKPGTPLWTSRTGHAHRKLGSSAAAKGKLRGPRIHSGAAQGQEGSVHAKRENRSQVRAESISCVLGPVGSYVGSKDAPCQWM
jgi:hypothetical protein